MGKVNMTMRPLSIGSVNMTMGALSIGSVDTTLRVPAAAYADGAGRLAAPTARPEMQESARGATASATLSLIVVLSRMTVTHQTNRVR
jgi:hypothetical protein